MRKTLFLPLDDLLAVVREVLDTDILRAVLGRCLRRDGVGNLRARAAGWRPGGMARLRELLPRMLPAGD